MKLIVKVGDLLNESADVIVCTANPQLNMSGGVNGAILLRGGEAIQAELHEYLKQSGQRTVAPGTVVRTSRGPLNATHLLHAVAVDVFYGSSVELVKQTLDGVFELAAELEAKTIAMPSLATGYGPLTIAEFGLALRGAMREERPPIEQITVVVRTEDYAEQLRYV